MTVWTPSGSSGGIVTASKITWGCNALTVSEEQLVVAVKEGIPLVFDFSMPCGCYNNCIFCGYLEYQKGKKLLNLDEIKSVIHQARELGCISMRIVGAGEVLTEEEALPILVETKKVGMSTAVFSCGDLLGDDAQCYKIHGFDGGELVARLAELGVTIMLKYDSKQQDDLTRTPGYSEKRNIALERLMNAGFNLHTPTHLGFGTVVLGRNYKEIPEIVDYVLAHNIYVLNCALMPIGRAEQQYKELGITGKEMIELAIKLYKIAWEYGVPVDKILEQPGTIPDFPGGLKCFISAAGFFVGPDGTINPCETHSDASIGNVRDVPLRVAWENKRNQRPRIRRE